MRIGERALLVGMHGQGAHDKRAAKGCPACELVATGQPLLCEDCKTPIRTVGVCADCLFKKFEDSE